MELFLHESPQQQAPIPACFSPCLLTSNGFTSSKTFLHTYIDTYNSITNESTFHPRSLLLALQYLRPCGLLDSLVIISATIISIEPLLFIFSPLFFSCPAQITRAYFEINSRSSLLRFSGRLGTLTPAVVEGHEGVDVLSTSPSGGQR